MSDKVIFFGYEMSHILETFHTSKDQVDSNGKIDKNSTTLSQLVGASQKLLQENGDFLYKIYNELD